MGFSTPSPLTGRRKTHHFDWREVLASRLGDRLLTEAQLEPILAELRAIDHVEIIRIGSRLPVVLPYRITDGLVQVLRKYHPLWVNTHFNHPRELTASARTALATLADAGIPLGNQSVLLAGVNDCPRIMKALVHKLVQNRVRPYYLYQCDLAEGLSHFRTPVEKGIEILRGLRGHTTGYAVPTYVIDAPGGGGKIPLQPNYVVGREGGDLVLGRSSRKPLRPKQRLAAPGARPRVIQRHSGGYCQPTRNHQRQGQRRAYVHLLHSAPKDRNLRDWPCRDQRGRAKIGE